jgi:pyrroline-5-carboxylate reductase
MNKLKIGIIGCGNMGQAFLKGMLDSDLIPAKNLFVFESDLKKLEELTSKYNINTYQEIDNTVANLDCLIIAVKPQDAKHVFSALSKQITNSNKLITIISIMAGITVDAIKGYFNTNNIIRLMPNLPATVGQGVTLSYYNSNISKDSIELSRSICGAIGKVVEVDSEMLIDAGTAISGSGPAYFFYLVEAMIEAAMKLGFNNEQAQVLVNQTFFGSSVIMQKQNISAKELRSNVTSKGGTTEAAINFLNNNRTKEVISEAIQEAFNKAKELSKN